MKNSPQHYKYLILGAGPAGLTFAYQLQKQGETSFLIVEQHEEAGGLCRSQMVDGSPLDIGGGHFLDEKNKAATSFLFQFLPREEWNLFERKTSIKLHGQELGYPIESHIWQLPDPLKQQYLQSIAEAGCNQGNPMPSQFTDWIYWKLGRRIADDYMIPYNKKIWSLDLNELGTYWLHKLPNVSYKNTLESCQQHKASGSLPCHAKFFYPKSYGYGEVWKRLAQTIKHHIVYDTPIYTLDAATRTINNQWQGDVIINTIPWQSFTSQSILPDKIHEAIKELKYNSIKVAYHSERLDTSAHWTYIPDESIAHHRSVHRFNFLPGAKGYWTEGHVNRRPASGEWSHQNTFAYPLSTIKKPEAIATILSWAETHHIYGLGRWGEWDHFNSDVIIERAIRLANTLLHNPISMTV